MTASLSICVFCGFSAGEGDRYLACARILGGLIGERGHRLVYGAGTGGLMGAVAEEVARTAGPIVGVIPRFLRARERADELPGQRLILTSDLPERKRRMITMADGFIALPGGYGTLDEVLEVVSMAALGVLSAPIALVDVDGVWTPFVALVESLRVRGFLRDTAAFTVVDHPAAALAYVETETAKTRRDPHPVPLRG